MLPLNRLNDDDLFAESAQMLGASPEEWIDQKVAITESATALTIKGEAVVMKAMDAHFAFRPDGYWRSEAYQRYKATEGKKGWDGYKRPLKLAYSKLGTIQRGFLSEVKDWCEKHRVEITGRLLPRPFDAVTADDIPPDIIKADFELDMQQRACVAALVRNAIGRVKVTVSGGKTAIACAVAALVKQRYPKARFLYFAPTERLVNQVAVEARKFLPDWDISQYGGNTVPKGKKDTRKDGKDMVVVTNAIMGRNHASLVSSGWLKTFWGLLVDECHHAASDTMEGVLLDSPAFLRVGLSDTTKEDDDTIASALTGLLGPILETVTAEAYIASGRIAKPHIYVVRREEWKNKLEDVPYVPVIGTPAWAYLDKQWHKGTYEGPVWLLNEEEGTLATDKKGNAIQKTGVHLLKLNGEDWEVESRWCLLERVRDRGIVRFKERNEQIAAWCKHFNGRGLPTIVVCTKTMHVLILEKLIGDAIGSDMVRSLFSDHSTGQRNKAFGWLKETPGSILVTPLVKEGVSINEIRGVVVADHVADWELMNQIIGRGIRNKKTDNFTEIVIFDDIQHPTMRMNTRAIVKKLKELGGYEFYENVRDPGCYKDAIFHGQRHFTF